MGLLFNDNNEINEKIKNEFVNLDNHLLAIKHNGIKKGLAKLLIIGGLYYTLDSNRTFILYFSNKGIHEEEISNSLKRDFLFMPWNEISSFDVEVKNNKAIIELVHIGKRIGYEIPFNGKIFGTNKANFKKLEDKDWNKI